MAGTREGGIAAAQTNIRKYGEDFYSTIGRLGGKVKGPKGFALMTPEQRAAAGRKGGANSRRGKSEWKQT